MVVFFRPKLHCQESMAESDEEFEWTQYSVCYLELFFVFLMSENSDDQQ